MNKFLVIQNLDAECWVDRDVLISDGTCLFSSFA